MNRNDDRVRLPVTLAMKDGRELTGNLIANMGGTLDRTLNNEALFVLFDGEDGERLIAKDGILEVCDRRKAPASNPSGLQPPTDTNPHKLLGISRTASDDEITAAFMQKAQVYRPDQFVSVALPAEVADYINTKYRLIYEAHQTLMEGKTPAITQLGAA